MKEKTITNQILKHLKSLPECFAFKEHGGLYGTSGIPDIIVCYKGKFLAFEVKTEKGKLSKLQEMTIAKIQKANGMAFKVTSLEEVKEILKGVMPEQKYFKVQNAKLHSTNYKAERIKNILNFVILRRITL